MKYPGDILYFLKFVGTDILIVAIAVLIMVFVAVWYFLARRAKKRPG